MCLYPTYSYCLPPCLIFPAGAEGMGWQLSELESHTKPVLREVHGGQFREAKHVLRSNGEVQNQDYKAQPEVKWVDGR